jgi:hypothetical protein
MNFEFIGPIWCVYEAFINLLLIFCGSREVIIQLDSDKAAVNLLLSLLLEKSKSCMLLLVELNLIAEYSYSADELKCEQTILLVN